MELHKLQEHAPLLGKDDKPCGQEKKYDRLCIDDNHKLRLIYWDLQTQRYLASYYIGAQWVDKESGEAIVVTPKMPHIDFMRMFMTCFNSGVAVESFNQIYKIDIDEPPITAPASLSTVLSPLLIVHFLSVVGRIKSLKKGYVHRSENLKTVKGRINIMPNERKNVMMKRYDRIYCSYDEYLVDIPENRLIKKALLFAKQVVMNIGVQSSANGSLRSLLGKDMAMFEQVSAEVEIREVKQIRGHKLFAEYKEAIRLAKLILRHFDYSIRKVAEEKKVTPFVIDMSLLYEHYVLGLLREAYGRENIKYQFEGEKGERPDFLYCSNAFKAILDAKYKPWLAETDYYAEEDVRQLSGYSRNEGVLRKGLEYKDMNDEHVPYCIFIYPTKGTKNNVNPFLGNVENVLRDKAKKLGGWYRFYKINVPLPINSGYASGEEW